MELKFKLGEEFDEKSPDGRDVKAIVTQEGDKFISVQTAKKEGEKSTEIIREFKGDEMIATSKCIGSDLVCTQVQETSLTYLLRNYEMKISSTTPKIRELNELFFCSICNLLQPNELEK